MDGWTNRWRKWLLQAYILTLLEPMASVIFDFRLIVLAIASIDNLQEIKLIAMHTTYDLYKNN